jgi:hypothetical protein
VFEVLELFFDSLDLQLLAGLGCPLLASPIEFVLIRPRPAAGGEGGPDAEDEQADTASIKYTTMLEHLTTL